MKRHHWLLLSSLVALALVLFAALMIVTAPTAIAPTKPSTQNLDDQTMQVARNLYCPVCPNTPLDVCDTQACQQWREEIRQDLAAGKTPEQIQQSFVAQFGERVLGAPRPQGLNLTIYIAPLVAIGVGALILYFVARRSGRQTAGAAPAQMPDEYRERVERELKESE